MDTCLARLFHPAMEGGDLAPAQDRAKTKNQLAHDSGARALPLQSVDDLRLLAGQLGARLAQQLNSAAATCGDSCLDPVQVAGSSCDVAGNAGIGLRFSAFASRHGEMNFASPE
jgi:hypothetical protein